MSTQLLKFTFLAVVIGVVLFSRMAYPAAEPDSLTRSGGAVIGSQETVPLFILPPLAVSAERVPDEDEAVGSDQAPVNLTSLPGVFTRTGNNPVPALAAAATLVADLRTGTIFTATNADRRWPTASIAKLLSATVVLDKLDPTAQISITDSMRLADPTDPILTIGGTYAVSDLLRLMLLPSSNVAAEALAAFYGRGPFIDEMNNRAAAWGLRYAYFNDPSGISAADQASASDLLKLAQKIYADYPEIFQLSRATQATVTETNSGARTVITNINQFAGGATFLGGKTGHTAEAGGNLLSVFRYQNRPIAVIVLGTEDRFNGTQALYDWFKANYQ